MQTSVLLSWSIGDTQYYDDIFIYQRGIDSGPSSANRRLQYAYYSSSYTVYQLSPGTTYEFYVQIVSYGLTAKTKTTTVTTGATRDVT